MFPKVPFEIEKDFVSLNYLKSVLEFEVFWREQCYKVTAILLSERTEIEFFFDLILTDFLEDS